MTEDFSGKLPEPQLNAIELRVLGALMEKQLSTPDAYPLTPNSLLLACNQKTSREPVTNYTSGDVQHCLRTLEQRKLVDIDYGSRAERYAQKLTRTLGIDKPTQAVLNVLMLRGPQTVNELLTRTQRMHEFAGAEEMEALLEHLCEKVIPVVCRIPRQAGQREDRFVQLLSGAPDLAAIASLGTARVVLPASALEERVLVLEQQLASLEKKVALLMLLGGVNEIDVSDSGLA